MKQEPTAWIHIHPINGKSHLDWKKDNAYNNVPLYTAPKELNDEEICQEIVKCIDSHNWYEFARAILKKASEK